MKKLDECGFERINEEKRTDNSKYHLHIKKEVKCESKRRYVPASNAELLAFLRIYFTSAMMRLESSYFLDHLFSLVWAWSIMTILKSLPTNYVHMVFGKYSPRSNFFLSKALPILYGSKIVIILTSLGLMLSIAIQSIGGLYVTFIGIYGRSPWNSCPNQTITMQNFTVRCYELEEYRNLIKDVPKYNIISHTLEGWFIFIKENDEEKFLLPQFLFQGSQIPAFFKNSLVLSLYLFFLVGVIIFTKDAIFKKPIWKFIQYINIGEIVMFSAIWLHMIYVHNEIPNYNSTKKIPSSFSEDVQNFVIINSDIWILSETLTCPPLLHFLTSQSNNRMFPNSASAVLALMNSIYLFTVNRLTFNINAYVLSIFAIDINTTIYNTFTELTSFCLYFNTFYFGEVFYLVYISFSSITLVVSTVVALHILNEAIICEWKWMNTWCLLLAWTVGLTVMIFDLDYVEEFTLLTQSWQIYAMILEMMALFVLYPYTRFIDDVLFQFGYPATIFQNVTYALGLLCSIVFLLLGVHAINNYENASESRMYAILKRNDILSVVIIMILGALYETLKIIYFQKRWQQLFVPYPEWGPSDYQLRAQRKHFIGSEYIESQAPRDLSRTMIRRRNHEVYSLDIDYIEATDTSSISYAHEKKVK